MSSSKLQSPEFRAAVCGDTGIENELKFHKRLQALQTFPVQTNFLRRILHEKRTSFAIMNGRRACPRNRTYDGNNIRSSEEMKRRRINSACVVLLHCPGLGRKYLQSLSIAYKEPSVLQRIISPLRRAYSSPPSKMNKALSVFVCCLFLAGSLSGEFPQLLFLTAILGYSPTSPFIDDEVANPHSL